MDFLVDLFDGLDMEALEANEIANRRVDILHNWRQRLANKTDGWISINSDIELDPPASCHWSRSDIQ